MVIEEDERFSPNSPKASKLGSNKGRQHGDSEQAFSTPGGYWKDRERFAKRQRRKDSTVPKLPQINVRRIDMDQSDQNLASFDLSAMINDSNERGLRGH